MSVEHRFDPWHSAGERGGYFTAHCECGWTAGDHFYGRTRSEADARAAAEAEHERHAAGQGPAEGDPTANPEGVPWSEREGR